MFRVVKSLVIALVVAWGSSAAATGVSTTELEGEIGRRLERVEQFKFLKSEAAKRGVRVYLFGGTAAGFAHYVKWDLLREKGDSRYQKDRFDYDYTNIFRSTQDLDVVVDGDMTDLAELQKIVKERYPHLQGQKSQWEFRPLRQQIGVAGQPGYKEAILESPDFMNQHTDSNSTGLVELTDPPRGEARVRDVRDWTSKPSQFSEDVANGTIKYYFSATHETTARYKAGDNPPLFSALRYLTKAFQYELEMTESDLARIEKIVAAFDPARDLASPRAHAWLIKNAKKLLQHAVDVEAASDWIRLLGLDKKLGGLDDPRVKESLAWWLQKEPLRTFEVGRGSGRTAKELGLDVVAHETRSMTAFESITRAHTGVPNVFISRKNGAGETAMHGDGFYTRKGTEGGIGTGQTIRFKVNPAAREGTDFFLAGQDFVVFTNRAALRVVPESLNLTPIEYFERLASGRKIEQADLGLLERLRSRLKTKAHALTPAEISKIDSVVEAAIQRGFKDSELYEAWIELPSSKANLRVKKALALANLGGKGTDALSRDLMSLDLTFDELVRLAYAPHLDVELSVELRRRALTKAATVADVVSLLKPQKDLPGTLNEKGEFTPLDPAELTRRQLRATKRRAFAREEISLFRAAAAKFWALKPDESTISRLVFQVEVRDQWNTIARELAGDLPDLASAEKLMHQVHKMALQNRDAEPFRSGWAAILIRANAKGWLAPNVTLFNMADPAVIGRGQYDNLVVAVEAERFDDGKLRSILEPLWKGSTVPEVAYRTELAKATARQQPAISSRRCEAVFVK